MSDALEAVRAAVRDKGSHPAYHDDMMARHRRQWPTLWRALDVLLKSPTGGERPKALYRVTATYSDPPRLPFRKHLQSKRAADAWVQRLTAGYSREGGGLDDYWSDTVPPAHTVTLETSDPITWSAR